MPAPARSPVWVAVATLAAAVYGWWAVSLPPFSARATVAVLIAGGVATVIGTLRRRRQQPPQRAAGAAWWGLVATAAAAWQLAAYLQHPRVEHPTLSSLANALLNTHMARAAAFVVWVAVALELARR